MFSQRGDAHHSQQRVHCTYAQKECDTNTTLSAKNTAHSDYCNAKMTLLSPSLHSPVVHLHTDRYAQHFSSIFVGL